MSRNFRGTLSTPEVALPSGILESPEDFRLLFDLKYRSLSEKVTFAQRRVPPGAVTRTSISDEYNTVMDQRLRGVVEI